MLSSGAPFSSGGKYYIAGAVKSCFAGIFQNGDDETTPTTCMEISLPIPKDAQATGIRSRDPPATPDAPQAPTVDTIHSNRLLGNQLQFPMCELPPGQERK